MMALPMSSNIFALSLDIQREADAFSGLIPAQPSLSMPAPAALARKPRWGLLWVACLIAAPSVGYQVVLAMHNNDLTEQMEQIDLARQRLQQEKQSFDRQKELAPKPSSLPAEPPAMNTAIDAPIPVLPITPATPVPAKAIEPQSVPLPASKVETPPQENAPQKVASISIPAAELQAAIRRARASGPKPAAKPAPNEGQSKPQAAPANWQDLPIEFIGADRSMIATVTPAGVLLKSGATVPVGGALSGTGERILAVDPPGTIITNRRILSITKN